MHSHTLSQHIQHLHASGHDMTLGCMMLLTANGVTSFFWSLGFMGWLQVIAMVASIIASCYVAYNQHLNKRWKSEQRRKEAEHQKHNDGGGRY